MFYSQTAGGFYDSDIHGDAMPSDVVEVSLEDWRALLQAQEAGKAIVWDAKKKKPVAVNRPGPSIEEERARMVVSRGQGRIALHRAGKLTALEAYITGSSAEPEMVIAYQDAATWSRNSSTTAALQVALGLSDEETDDLFRAAALIEY